MERERGDLTPLLNYRRNLADQHHLSDAEIVARWLAEGLRDSAGAIAPLPANHLQPDEKRIPWKW